MSRPAPKKGFPEGFAELVAAGYIEENRAHCRACGAPIVFYITPKNRRIPIDADGRQSHFATCPRADQFRKTRRK